MVGQPEQSVFDPLVYEWEVTDPVQGGAGGVANTPLLALANRTRWLYDQVIALRNGLAIPVGLAPLNGPAFTGSATSPNVAPGDNSSLIANTNFVQTARGGIAVVPVGGNINITLGQPQWGVAILVFTGVLTGNVTVIFPTQTGAWIASNLTTGAFNLTCATAAGAGVVIPQDMRNAGIWCDGTSIFRQNSLYNLTPGTYTSATVTVAADGRITSIGQGTSAAPLTPGVYSPAIVTVASDGHISAVSQGAGTGLTPGTFTKATVVVAGDGHISSISQGAGSGMNPGTFSNATVTVAPGGDITGVTQGSLPPGRLLGVQVFSTPGASVYTASDGTTSVIVEVQGAGGAGGGCLITAANGTSIGAPGASGAYGRSRYTSGFSGIAVTVGGGGLKHQGAAGSPGGASSFGSLLTCPGGPGGGISLALTTIVAGGNGGIVSPTGANLVAASSDAGGVSASIDANSSWGAAGGRSMFGGGAPGASVNAFANNATSPGSGGAGTANFNNGTFSSIGGNGANGLVLVYEYA
jgi:hypothetical protein